MTGHWKAYQFWAAILLLIFAGCKQKQTLSISQQLQGEWISIQSKPRFYGFSGDSIEFLHSFFCKGEYSKLYKTSTQNNLGQFAKFRIENNVIRYLDPCFGSWQLLGTIRLLRNDSLVLKMPIPEKGNKQKILTFIREKPSAVYSLDFDKIAFSKITWNYTLLSNEIAVDKKGHVYFGGATWNHQPGFYYGKIDTAYIKYLFEKFQKAKFHTLSDEIDDGTIDGSTAYFTLIKNKKIVKTLKYHFGEIYPPTCTLDLKIRLAYNAISNLPAKLEREQKLRPQLSALPVTALNLILFFDGKNFMELDPSQSLYFWTELQKAKPVAVTFTPTYSLFCSERFGLFEQQQGKHPDPLIYALATDGRYFKFPDKNGKHRIYDLGYNFLEQNNLKNTFKPATPTDLDRIRNRAHGNL